MILIFLVIKTTISRIIHHDILIWGWVFNADYAQKYVQKRTGTYMTWIGYCGLVPVRSWVFIGPQRQPWAISWTFGDGSGRELRLRKSLDSDKSGNERLISPRSFHHVMTSPNSYFKAIRNGHWRFTGKITIIYWNYCHYFDWALILLRKTNT